MHEARTDRVDQPANSTAAAAAQSKADSEKTTHGRCCDTDEAGRGLQQLKPVDASCGITVASTGQTRADAEAKARDAAPRN